MEPRGLYRNQRPLHIPSRLSPTPHTESHSFNKHLKSPSVSGLTAVSFNKKINRVFLKVFRPAHDIICGAVRLLMLFPRPDLACHRFNSEQ